MKVAIIGYGTVGVGMHMIFPEAIIVDPAKSNVSLQSIKDVDLAVVCVPTPQSPNGSCDTSIVRSVVQECEARVLLIKSTVTPGTVKELVEQTGKSIVFSPEYMGETKHWTPAQFPDPNDPRTHGFVILGGEQEDCSFVADALLPRLGPATRFRFMNSTEAELVKYLENAYFSLKVTYANEIRRICEKVGVNYHVVREGWLDDPRVGPMHTAAFKEQRGFSGKCLPKDLAALAAFCRDMDLDDSLFETVLKINSNSVRRF